MTMETQTNLTGELTYLGDGAYCKMQDNTLIIYTHNGFFSTNSVYLEREAMQCLYTTLTALLT